LADFAGAADLADLDKPAYADDTREPLPGGGDEGSGLAHGIAQGHRAVEDRDGHAALGRENGRSLRCHAAAHRQARNAGRRRAPGHAECGLAEGGLGVHLALARDNEVRPSET
jgi:hypothetical protein